MYIPKHELQAFDLLAIAADDLVRPNQGTYRAKLYIVEGGTEAEPNSVTTTLSNGQRLAVVFLPEFAPAKS